MSIQKNLRYYFGIGTILLFIIILIIHFLPPIPINIPLITGHDIFWENILIGIFGGFLIGFISSIIIYNYEKEKSCFFLIRKIKFLESSMKAFINGCKPLEESNKRYEDINNKIKEVQNQNEKDELINELKNEEINRKEHIFIAKELVEKWNIISIKANEIKEDYTFNDIFTNKNKDNVYKALQLLFNIENNASIIKSRFSSGIFPEITNLDINLCFKDVNLCLVHIIEASYSGKKREILKNIYCINYKENMYMSTIKVIMKLISEIYKN